VLDPSFEGDSRRFIDWDCCHRRYRSDSLPVVIDQFRLNASVRIRVARVRDIDGCPECSILVFGVECGLDIDIADVGIRRGRQRNVPEDAAHPPHVLVLDVTAVTPLEHPDSDGVFAGFEGVCYVELGGNASTLTVADAFAVYPDVESRVDPLEAERYPTV
jgi:hypothetical protein